MNVLTICSPNEEMAIVKLASWPVRSKPWHRTSVVSWSSLFSAVILAERASPFAPYVSTRGPS